MITGFVLAKAETDEDGASITVMSCTGECNKCNEENGAPVIETVVAVFKFKEVLPESWRKVLEGGDEISLFPPACFQQDLDGDDFCMHTKTEGSA